MLIQSTRPPFVLASASRQVTDIVHGKATVYAADEQGEVFVQEGGNGRASGSGTLLLKNMFFPVDMHRSVSRDYLPTRAWDCARDLVHAVGGFVVGAAVFAALGLDPLWGGAGMQTYNMIRDRMCQAVGFVTSFHVDKAMKNPRAWILGGEVIANVGTLVQACAALPAVTSQVPGGILAVTLSAFAISTIAGVMSGAASASINPRQAVGDNLGELQVKNGNQGTVVSLVGGLAGLELARHLSGGASALMVAGVVGILGVVTMAQFVKHLDYHPVNEQGLRRVVDHLDREGQVVGPARDRFLPMMASLRCRDRIVLGRSGRPLLENPQRWEQLRHLYKGRQYLLDLREGEPYVLLREGCEPQDRMQATLQIIRLEGLRASHAFARLQLEQGTAAAERWLVKESLSQTPADVQPLLADMKKAGWSTDLIRLSDTGIRARWEDPAPGEEPPPESRLEPDRAGKAPSSSGNWLRAAVLGLNLAAAPSLPPPRVSRVGPRAVFQRPLGGSE
jgi:hypothetical protein